MRSSWSWPCQLLCSWSAVGKAALPPQTEPGTARGLAKQVQVRPSVSATLWRNHPPFPCSVATFLTRLHPPSTSPIPSRTQNAPRSAFFGFSGWGSLFCCRLSSPKSSGMILWLGWRPLSLSSTKKAGISPGLFQLISLTPFCRCRAGNTCLFAPAALGGCPAR